MRLILILLLCCSHLFAAESGKKEKPKQAALNQEHLMNQMKRYLTVQNREVSPTLNRGVCNGLSFLAQYYASLNLEKEFFTSLKLMSEWNGKKKRLKKNYVIGGDSIALGDLFEQWINDSLWFQFSDVKLDSFMNFQFTLQHKRIMQFEFIKASHDHREIVMLLSPITFYGLTLDQLEEWLAIWSLYPNTILEFGARQHATSARVLEGRSFAYYDPNESEGMKVVTSPKELALEIQRTKYKLLGFPHEEMEIGLMAYQYLEEGAKLNTPRAHAVKKILKTGPQSPNHFTPLHSAILANDLKAFRQSLHKDHQDPNLATNECDKIYRGVTPLLLGVLMGREKFVAELLEHPQIDIYKSSGSGLDPLMAAIGNLNVDLTILLLKHGANPFITAAEQYGLVEINALLNEGKGNALRFIRLPAYALGVMKHPMELRFIKEVYLKFPEFLEMRDASGLSLLHYAVIFKNPELVDLISELRPNEAGL